MTLTLTISIAKHRAECAGTLQWLDLSNNVSLELDARGVATLVALPKLARLALSKPGLPKLGIFGGEQVSAH